MPSPRVLATHRHFHDLPIDFIINKRKLVVVLRDPGTCMCSSTLCASSCPCWNTKERLTASSIYFLAERYVLAWFLSACDYCSVFSRLSLTACLFLSLCLRFCVCLPLSLSVCLSQSLFLSHSLPTLVHSKTHMFSSAVFTVAFYECSSVYVHWNA